MAGLREEQLRLWTQWKVENKPEYMEDLLDSLQPLIKDYVRQFADGPIPYNALLARANIIARDSLKNYNPGQSAIGTFVTHQLQPMHRYVAKYQNVKYAPEYLSQEYGRYEEALRTLQNKFDRYPTDEEVSNYMNIPVAHVQRIQQSIAPETFVSTIPEEMGDDENFNLMVSSRQEDDLAYLRSELTGAELRAFDLVSGKSQKPITDMKTVADRLKVNVSDVYRWRRNWANRLRSVRTW